MKTGTNKKKIYMKLKKEFQATDIKESSIPKYKTKIELELPYISSEYMSTNASINQNLNSNRSIDSNKKFIFDNSALLDFLKEKNVETPRKDRKVKRFKITRSIDFSQAKFKNIKTFEKDNVEFKDKITSFRKLLKEKLNIKNNVTDLPEITIKSNNVKIESQSRNQELKYLSTEINDSLENRLKYLNLIRKNKIVPTNIKIRNFKASVERKFLVLSNEKFVF